MILYLFFFRRVNWNSSSCVWNGGVSRISAPLNAYFLVTSHVRMVFGMAFHKREPVRTYQLVIGFEVGSACEMGVTPLVVLMKCFISLVPRLHPLRDNDLGQGKEFGCPNQAGLCWLPTWPIRMQVYFYYQLHLQKCRYSPDLFPLA